MNCKFVIDFIPNIDAKALGLSNEANVLPDDVVMAFVPAKGYEQAYNSPTGVFIRSSEKAEEFAKAIQKAQIADFLQIHLKMDVVEIPEAKYDAVIDAINYFLECEEADKSTAEALIIEQIAASDVNAPVSPEAVVAVFEEKIENDTLIVPTGLVTEEVTEEQASDALQITPAEKPAVVPAIPAGTLPVDATRLREIYSDVITLKKAADAVSENIQQVILEALDVVAGQANSTVAEPEDAQISL